MQKILARASFVHNSPRKMRLVSNAVAKLEPVRAIDYLKIVPNAAAKPLLRVFQQAMANAKNNFKISPGDLKIASLVISEGPRGPKKADVHAHGARFDRGVRRKRMSHITLELVTKEAK